MVEHRWPICWLDVKCPSPVNPVKLTCSVGPFITQHWLVCSVSVCVFFVVICLVDLLFPLVLHQDKTDRGNSAIAYNVVVVFIYIVAFYLKHEHGAKSILSVSHL